MTASAPFEDTANYPLHSPLVFFLSDSVLLATYGAQAKVLRTSTRERSTEPLRPSLRLRRSEDIPVRLRICVLIMRDACAADRSHHLVEHAAAVCS
jgi:hypothetical protein